MKKVISLFFTITFVFMLPHGISAKKLTFGDLAGRWKLLYRGQYGYEFRYYKNYQAITILYLRNHALVFKGVYNFEKENTVRINIYQMKNERNISRINLKSKFVKTSSSYFIFKVELQKSKQNKILIMRPVRVVIDGQDSNGYFEPAIKLKKTG